MIQRIDPDSSRATHARNGAQAPSNGAPLSRGVPLAGSPCRYPTPVAEARAFHTRRGELWIKNDGLTHPAYGGNKVRKLERILDRAEQCGARRVVTMGAAGSHHVLATTLFARTRGLSVTAVLWPQPRSVHAESTLRAALAHGLDMVPASSPATALARAVSLSKRGDFFIPVGGLGKEALLAYAAAAGELRRQVDAGVVPEPDVIVVPVGTGSTAAGLLAGCVQHGLSSRIVGVLVAQNPVARGWVLSLALSTLRALGGTAHAFAARRQLELDPRQVGPGYGWATFRADEAAKTGRLVGLHLDPTYTSKAFARALREIGYPGFAADFDKVRLARPRRTLYWHTLSSAPLSPLLEGAPALPDLAGSLFL